MNEQFFKTHSRNTVYYLRSFAVWVLVGLMLGILGGLVGGAFCWSIAKATDIFQTHSWIVWLLPIAGLLIVFLFSLRGMTPTDTNGILLAVHTPSSIPTATGPLIFIGTVLTHMFGGSAGREGAALQLGGVLGWRLSRIFNKDEKDAHMFVMAGMSAVFSALFGAPITAAIFAMEVASVGILHFSGLIPCLTASITATWLTNFIGVESEIYPTITTELLNLQNVGSVVGIAAACAVVSILYCVSLRQMGGFLKKKIPNSYLRIAIGGLSVAILTWIVGTNIYNGGGMPTIFKALEGNANWQDFLLKFVFTVLTMSCGYKGGEIVPCMFIGATLGCVLGSLFGINPGLGAAVGLVCMFCGSLNCPISALFLGIELFGSGNILFFAIACAVSFMLSANFGLYKEQKIMYSKLKPEFINKYTD